MSDPTPVPLTDIEAAARTATEGPWHQMAAAAWSGTNENPDLVADCPLYADAIHIAATDPPTVLALCEALRIAVEGLRFSAADFAVAATRSPDIGEYETLSASASAAADTLAAVRELVDLGEKP